MIGEVTIQLAKEMLEREGYQVISPETALNIPIIESLAVEPGTVILYHDGKVVGQIRDIELEATR